MKDALLNSWHLFTQNFHGHAFTRKIQNGINNQLLEALNKSHHYSFKSKKIPSMSSQREKEWAEARRGELEMEEHFEKLIGNSQFEMLSSVSHTKELVIGVSLLKNTASQIQGVGVDIESTQRVIDEKVIERFIKSSDLVKYNDLKALDFWVLKEAAFKATPADLQLVVTSYDLSFWDHQLKEGLMQSKNAQCKVKLIHTNGYTIGLSFF